MANHDRVCLGNGSMVRAVGGLAILLALGCGGLVNGARERFQDKYQEEFRARFGAACRKDIGKPEVCDCLADQLVQRVPPRRLVDLTLNPDDAELQKLVKNTLEACMKQVGQ